MIEDNVVMFGVTFYSLGVLACIVNFVFVNVAAQMRSRRVSINCIK